MVAGTPGHDESSDWFKQIDTRRDWMLLHSMGPHWSGNILALADWSTQAKYPILTNWLRLWYKDYIPLQGRRQGEYEGGGEERQRKKKILNTLP